MFVRLIVQHIINIYFSSRFLANKIFFIAILYDFNIYLNLTPKTFRLIHVISKFFELRIKYFIAIFVKRHNSKHRVCVRMFCGQI